MEVPVVPEGMRFDEPPPGDPALTSITWGLAACTALRCLWALLLLSPSLAAQDASIPTSGAEDFLGEWRVTFPQPEGPVSIVLSLVDDGGQVGGGVLDAGERFILVEEIMMSGPELLLGFRMEFEGQRSQVMIYLLPDGEGLVVRLEGGGGAFTVTGRGSRPPGHPDAG